MAAGPGVPPAFRLRLIPTLAVGGVLVIALAVVVGLLIGEHHPARTAGAPSASASAAPSSSSAPTVNQIYQHVGPSVVVIQTAKGELGTGVIVTAAGSVLTANHVIADGSAITLTFADGTKSTAAVASADPSTDTAILTPATLPQPIVPATIGGSVAVGNPVVAIGNPFGLTYSVSSGVVSGLDRAAVTSNGRYGGLIQFDAAVNPGSSGGPLLDAKGDLVGIVVSIADPNAQGSKDAFAGIAFGVPIGAALGGGSGSGPGGGGPQI